MVRITGPRSVVVAPLGDASTGSDASGVTLPDVPGTNTSDRARLNGARTTLGSNIAAAMLGLGRAGFSLRATTLLDAAAKAATPALAADVAVAIDALAARPHGEATALKLLTGGPKGAATSALDGAIALAGWIRKERAINALAGHHDAIAKKLLEPLSLEPDAARRDAALATVEALAKKSSGSYELAAILRGAGCLPDTHDWRDQALVAGSDPIGALARRSPTAPAAYDAPADAAALEAKLSARGLFGSAKWCHTSDVPTHRGIIGEVSRLTQIEPTLGPHQSVVQGILVMESPPGLWDAPSLEAAKSWVNERGYGSAWLHKYKAPDGSTHYGVLKTEIDAAVFEKKPDGTLAAIRLENVKAGIGSAPKAAEQNAVAKNGWTNPAFHYLFPNDDGSYHEPKLDRSPEAAAKIATATVGPSDDPRYDVHLPLSMHDITLLAEQHP